MRLLDSLTTAFIAGIVVAVIALGVQAVSTSATANYSADGSRAVNLLLPGVIGALAGVGAFVLQWGSPGSSRRKRPRA